MENEARRAAGTDWDLDADMTAMRHLFASQLAGATRADGSVDQEALSAIVTGFYTRARAASQADAARFSAVLENMAQGLCFFDSEQRLIVCNQRYAEIYGLRPEHVAPGTTLRDIVEQRYLAGSTPAMTTAEYLQWRDKVAEGDRPHDSVLQLQNGRAIGIRHQPMPGGGWVATHEDITERRETERQLAHLELHHAVTGLPNRTLLAAQLQEALGRASATAPCAALALSLDGFRAVNDTFGRTVGEGLLRAMAERLRQRLRPGDLLGQPGGNEFVIVQSDLAQPAEATRLAEQLLTLVAEPAVVDGQRLVASASIGIAVAFAAGLDADTFMKNANIALQRAKTEGRGRYRLFEPAMDEMVQARRLLELDLREAVGRMAFELHYQPQFDIRTRQVTGFEALLRWTHPVRGAVPPGAFIPVAEEIGLIGQIGEWVLRQACADAASWPERISVAVNVSALQLNDGALPGIVADALRHSGLAPSRLELEITESRMVENTASAGAMLSQLRAGGVRIAMDDFGTGYSSLSYLPSLSFDKIKIDRSFVMKLGQAPAHAAIVRAIVNLCSSLGVACIAEGVETEAQLAILALEGCAMAQGNLLGRPSPARAIAGLLRPPA